MQNIANKYEKTVFQVFGIAGHGKGEVDHIGGIAKVVIRWQIAAGSFFPDSSDMVEFLNEKFEDHDSPRYKFKEIDTKQLEIARNLVKNKRFQGIHGSSHFQLMIFTPRMNVIKASNRLCICKSCQNIYGSCSIFKEFILKSNDLNQNQLRSDVPAPESCELSGGTTTESNLLTEYITPDSNVAVAADSNSIETVWFIKVIENECVSNGEDQDDYDHIIIENAMFHKRNIRQSV